jgi:hypothetical protein
MGLEAGLKGLGAEKMADTATAPDPTHFVLLRAAPYDSFRNLYDDLTGLNKDYRVIGCGNAQQATDIAFGWVERNGGTVKIVRTNLEVRAKAAVEAV